MTAKLKSIIVDIVYIVVAVAYIQCLYGGGCTYLYIIKLRTLFCFLNANLYEQTYSVQIDRGLYLQGKLRKNKYSKYSKLPKYSTSKVVWKRVH